MTIAWNERDMLFAIRSGQRQPFAPALNMPRHEALAGGWRFAAIQSYSSGYPLGVTTNAPLNIFNGTNRPNVTGADWRAPIAGDEFNPLVDRYLNRAAFVQPVAALGNAPRINPDVRRPWNLNENVSLAKSIKVSSRAVSRALFSA